MEYIVPIENHCAMIPFGLFYGYNSQYYLDIMMEFGECRERLTQLIGNCIVQRNVYQLSDFREMVYMQLGYMGIDHNETLFYERMVQFLQYICINCYPFVVGQSVTFLDAVEDAEWVNLFYRTSGEPVLCHVQ